MKFPRDCGCDRARAARRRPPALRAALLLPPPLLLLLLVPRAAAAPLPNADSSGEAELDEAAGRRAALPDSLRLARLLHARAAQLQDEMCEKFAVCQNSVEMLLYNNLNLPKVTEEDGCLLAGFNEDKCLRKISSGLYTFQTYLKYIQETFISENQNVESLSYSAEHLARTIRQMVINPEEVIIPDAATQESLHTKLKSTNAWTKKITIHLILRDFTSFMEKTVRAVRYLKNTRSFSV
ncbi:interleukin-6 isoform X1 [Haemorhous mexicanus]|nr:interleukin-6 isoform X1 [Haemorhous mexicanus]XP_059700734.1 interleukin-6 isoform X1 [Haemorhous mexicanus]XP_059700744.1 interleukin-6 isoform X1 [Haemorhous mexicanus]XP_059700753.1 interleukin-6 isoform X1 [Haemorhous mexicanus]